MDYRALLPEIALVIMSLALFCATIGNPGRRLVERAGLLLAAASFGAALLSLGRQGTFFHGAYRVDLFSQYFKILITLGLALILWMGTGMRGINRQLRPEYVLFLALSCLGLTLMVSAVELLTIAISIEIASYSLFVLIPLRRQPFQREPLEASIKYYFLGAMATGITLYGMSYLFGLTRSTYLADIARLLPGCIESRPLAVIGLAMVLCGAFYKLALFPLHFWMPDVFVGAAHETTCFVATVPKIAAVGLIVRLVSLAGPDSREVAQLLSIMAVLSMFAGNLSAITQQDIKRLLAYSSIAHAGYLMVGILTMSSLGVAASMYYIGGYLLMNLACFMVLYHLAPDGENVSVDDLGGLYRRSPLLSLLLAAGAVGLAGIPPTIGFTGKFMIFSGAFQRGMYVLVGLSIVNVCISAFYYLRLVRAAYRGTGECGPPIALTGPAALLGIAIIGGIVASGLFPQELFLIAMEALSGF